MIFSRKGSGLQQGIGTLVVVGVGLIGGSFSLALKRAGRVGHVIGVDRSRENLQRALELGVIDVACDDLAQAARGADMVLLATPVGQMATQLATLAPVLAATTIVSDVGSTKCDVVAMLRRHLPGHLARCVPAHPIAGSELTGAAAAQYGLYDGRNVVLAPLPETDAAVCERVAGLWQACGARVHCMGAHEHDAVFAAVSHLPHLLAFSYVGMVARRADAARCFDFAATGFRDFTRIAGSSAEMWRDIALANREALLAELADYRAALDSLSVQLEAGDGDALLDAFDTARAARNAWHQRFMRQG
ncbi:prephenate dehydrogenase [Paludibacterium yongneupense]|uniref:prephenate dehydrogenase n=1 Tax=Paludibacterium yongneupense TaxID=400061 RepID=UPI001FE74E09|nr:prephenate dehydrogenase/arogenate dehydrogenase family protein [Paludibacterium yongneupense]